ncbi:hypothetical protein ABMX48_29305 [Streptomyces cavourensis]
MAGKELGSFEIAAARRGDTRRWVVHIFYVGMGVLGAASLYGIAALVKQGHEANQSSRKLTNEQLTAMLGLLSGLVTAVLLLGFVAVAQTLRLRRIGARARRMESSMGITADAAVAVYRTRIEADARAKVQFEKEEWERGRDAWKAAETARIYEQVIDQQQRGLLGSFACTNCQPDDWRRAG